MSASYFYDRKPLRLMRGAYTHSFFILLLTVLLIIARPFFIYSSPVVRHSIEQQSKGFGLARAVRKRSEYVYTSEEFAVADDPLEQIIRYLLPALFFAVPKWRQQLLFLLAAFFSYLLSFSKRIQSLFQLVPQEERYLSLSVIRI